MNLIGIKVKNCKFGEGEIVNVYCNGDRKYIKVKFDEDEAEFQFPSAFEKYLEALDCENQKEILKEILKEKKNPEPINKKPVVSTPDPDFGNLFKQDYNVQNLARTPILTYQEVESAFKIKISGFGRGINITPSSIVLISRIEKKSDYFVYHDHWTEDGDYIYSGEGKTGDQKFSRGNKAIVDAEYYGKEIHLFVKFSSTQYYYQGKFKLVDYTYENDLDENGLLRKEYKFQLRKIQ